jgi:hypothetical protein
MVWSRITLLMFVAGSLVLLGVGITNLRYQRVNSLQYQHHQTKYTQDDSSSSSSISSTTIKKHQNFTTDMTWNPQHIQSRIRDNNDNETNNTKSSPFSTSSSSSSSSKQWPPTATEIADYYSDTITFGELASAMVLAWYQQTIRAIDHYASVYMDNGTPSTRRNQTKNATTTTTIISRDVGKEDLEWTVYRIRTLVWYTRELLDVFAPLYHNSTHAVNQSRSTKTNTTGNATVEEEPDLYCTLQTSLAYGYKSTKSLTKVTKLTTIEQNDSSLSLANQWITNITEFDRSHRMQLKEVLQKAPLVDRNPSGKDDPSPSSLYWQGSTTLVTSDTEASRALAVLGTAQLTRIQSHLQDIRGKDTKNSWNPKKAGALSSKSKEPDDDDDDDDDDNIHVIIHQLQKEIQALVDQQALFQDYFIPRTEDPDKAIVLLKETKALLGSIHDDWKQLVRTYELTGKLKAPRRTRHKLKRSLKMQWKGFQWWVEAVDVEGAVQTLLAGMVRRSQSQYV